VEKNRLGGDCLYYGCVPSNTLLHSAKLAQQQRMSRSFGIEPHQPCVQIGQVMQRVREVISGLDPNDSPERFKAKASRSFSAEDSFKVASSFQSMNGR
jgi:pyruvate/2-oxoglutarate dehydrogenase complex dihydrolipoamide dehydrogenase (E3) component